MSATTATGVQYASGQDFYDNILTDHYRNVVVDGRNNSTVLATKIPKNTEFVGGKFIGWPARTTRNTGVNSVRMAPGFKMPDPGFQGSEWFTMKPRHIYARCKVDGPTMTAARLDVDRYIDLIDTEIGGLTDDISVVENIMLHNDGTGRLAEVVSVVANTSVTLRVNQGIEGATTCTSPATMYLTPGMRVGFLAADGTTMAVFYILSVSGNVITTALTLGGANDTTGIVANDWVVRASTTDAITSPEFSSGYKSEPMGLAGIFSDNNIPDGNGRASGQTGTDYYGTTTTLWGFQGVDAASLSFNQAIVLDNGGVARPLTEALMQQAFSDVEERNGGAIDLMLSGFAARDTYVDLLLPSKRFNNTMELEGGHAALNFNGRAWVQDRHCYRNRVYFLGLRQGGFTRYEVEPLNFLDFHGHKWDRTGFDDDAWQCAMVERFNYGVNVRDRCGALLVDITEIR
jgi:hypothetical protein